LDKQGLIQALQGGHGEPIGQVVSRPMFGFNPDVKPYAFDQARARQLLTEAGYPNGFTIAFECDQARKEICEAISLQLSRVGVTARLQVLDNTVYNQRINARTVPPMFWHSWLGLTVDADGTLNPRIMSGSRVSFFADPGVDAQIRAAGSKVREDERRAIYMPLMVELNEKAPWLYLWQGIDFYGVSTRLQGWTPRPDSYILLGDVDIAN